ncbi:SDR family oxidoreductase [Stratiformator vulcanicus]|uniref:NAD dependent epimerase/dehydratase family protein n=1 Tax=Stratiformator vulcanicus TaxID=2527980 RepID=A0A517R5X7_9PLAN|nr:SDR family oxidoreductase [Stratiformator vulcanicus]QDT39304.1 NAD dependent epimerase/dehydratase family protein [Stratiformator vulcanicus]
MPKRMIVGCGYLGLRAARAWLQAGDSVSALTRSPERADQLREIGLEPIVGDVTEPDSLSDLPEADTLLFAVGLDRSAGKSQREVYVNGLRHTLERMAGRCGRTIYVSSTSVYGESDGRWIDEQTAAAPTRDSGRVCLDAEQVFDEFSNSIPERVILRFAGIYGPDRLLRRISQLKEREPIAGDPDAWLNLIHVDDGVAVVRAAAGAKQPSTTFLVSDDQPVRRADYYEVLAELAGTAEPIFDKDRDARHSSGTGKRCRNRQMKDEFSLSLSFPTYHEGLKDAVNRSDDLG